MAKQKPLKGLGDLELIIKKDPRYHLEAYLFVLKALDHTRKMLQKKWHVTGHELLHGIRELALRNYGLMSKTVLAHWGVTNTRDLGNIVFNMVNAKILTKTEEDDIQDFDNVFDFDEAFVSSYTFHIDQHK